MRSLFLLATAASLFGCQPEPVWTADSLASGSVAQATCSIEAPPPSGCASRCGTYVTHFQHIEGDCGKRADQTAVLAGDPSAAPYPCRGHFTPSPDRCSLQFDIRCPTKDESGSTLASIERGTLSWSADAARASGNLDLWLLNANDEARCRSTYQVSIERKPP